MPFGAIFAALFFFLCAWLGWKLAGSFTGTGRLGSALLASLTLSLAIGLLMQRAWARWGGALAAAGLAAVGVWLIGRRGGGADFAVCFASLASCALLVIPGTGRPSRAGARGGTASRALGLVAAASAAGLVALAGWAPREVPKTTAETAPPEGLTRVASAPRERAQPARWQAFGPGLEQARAEGKLLLAYFVTSWCGYCKKMDDQTWSHPTVAQRLTDLVPVRVDTEDTRPIGGFTGASLGARYRIDGTPTTILLDAGGAVLARADGYRTPEQLLTWLESSLSRSAQHGNRRP